MGTTWGPRGQHGVGTMGTTDDHGDHRPWRPHGDPSGGYGDDVGMMGMTRG